MSKNLIYNIHAKSERYGEYERVSETGTGRDIFDLYMWINGRSQKDGEYERERYRDRQRHI